METDAMVKTYQCTHAADATCGGFWDFSPGDDLLGSAVALIVPESLLMGVEYA